MGAGEERPADPSGGQDAAHVHMFDAKWPGRRYS